MARYSRLPITGYAGRPVNNTFVRQEPPSNILAILLPGRGYRATMPLLHYPELLLTWMGADVLRLEYAYDEEQEFIDSPDAVQTEWFFEDVRKSGHAALSQREYDKLVLVGKSMGTLAMGHLLTTEPRFEEALCVWLTPLVGADTLRQQIGNARSPGFLVIGTEDPHYNAELLERMGSTSTIHVAVIEGGNHGLTVDNDVQQSIAVIKAMMEGLEGFLTGYLPESQDRVEL